MTITYKGRYWELTTPKDVLRITVTKNTSDSYTNELNCLCFHLVYPKMTRTLFVEGVDNSEFFYNECLNCYKYQHKDCVGGSTVLSAGNCNIHQSRQLTKIMPVKKELYPSVLTVCPFISKAYWNILRINEETSDFEVIPYAIGNVYITRKGQYCLGENHLNRTSLIHCADTIFNGIRNRDLIPEKYNDAIEWVTAHTLELQEKELRSVDWLEVTDKLNPQKNNHSASTEKEISTIKSIVILQSKNYSQWLPEHQEIIPFLELGTNEFIIGFRLEDNTIMLNHDRFQISMSQLETLCNKVEMNYD